MLCGCKQQELALLPELEALVDSGDDFEDDTSDLFSNDEADAGPFDSLLESELEEEVDRRSREYVRWVQRSLNNLIGARLALDGISGRKTRSAVRRFQRQARITADGAVGSQTEAALIRAGADPPSGSRTITFEPENISGAIVLDRFIFNSNKSPSFHRPIIQRIAATVVSSQHSARPIRTVRLIGHTDSVGSDEFNRGLGLQRAKSVRRALQSEIDRQQPGLSSRIRITTDTRGESQPQTNNSTSAGRARNRRVEVILVRSTRPPPQRPPAPRSRTSVLNVVAKSFIQPIRRLGRIWCPGAPIAQAKLAVLGEKTRQYFRENPRTAADDGRYRLYTHVTFTVECRGDKVLSVVSSFTDTDVGRECIPYPVCFRPPPLQMTSVRVRRRNPKSFDFSWRGRGRPNNAAEVSFQLVCPRTSRYIWHDVRGRIECRNGFARVTNVWFRGSRFPSHRLFVNGVCRKEVRQRAFSNLWVPSRRNRNDVR